MDIKDIDKDKLKKLIADFVDRRKGEFSKNCEKLYRELDWGWEIKTPSKKKIAKHLKDLKDDLFKSIDKGRLSSNICGGGIGLSYAVTGDIVELSTVDISMNFTYEESEFFDTYSIVKE